MDEDVRPVTVEVRVGEEPIAGWCVRNGERTAFRGWIELATVLELARSEAPFPVDDQNSVP